MRKAINFDIDTKKYEKYTGKPAPTAYMEIKKFLYIYEFEHRQGSGYISKGNVNNSDIITLATNMSLTFDWLKHCVKKMDVTNIGKQHSLTNTISKATADENMPNLKELEL